MATVNPTIQVKGIRHRQRDELLEQFWRGDLDLRSLLCFASRLYNSPQATPNARLYRRHRDSN